MAKMRYKGNGFKVGVPARDLSAAEVKRFGRDYLLSLGLYEDAYQPKPKKVYEAEDIKKEKHEKAEEA